MMNTFDSYLCEPLALDFAKMQSLHSELAAEIGSDADAMELYEEFVGVATKYAAIRAEWLSLSKEEKMGKDRSRSSHHNGVIVYLNMLARYLRIQGKKAAWRDELGDEEADKMCRKTIGDFACYIAFVNGLCAR